LQKSNSYEYLIHKAINKLRKPIILIIIQSS
jgi:hypothetical protein